MHYDIFETPPGRRSIAADAAGRPHVLFPHTRHGEPGRKHWRHAPEQLAGARRQRLEYFAGRRRIFDLPLAPVGTPSQLDSPTRGRYRLRRPRLPSHASCCRTSADLPDPVPDPALSRRPDYHGRMNLRSAPMRACALLLVAGLLAACTHRPASSTVPQARSLLLVSIDGLRADFLGRGLTPNIDALAADGVRARWMSPSYPSLTFPNHYTLVTGLRPDHHAIVHNMMSDDALGDFRVADANSTQDARWWAGTPLWVSVERSGRVSASWAWPGSHASIEGVRPEYRHDYDDGITPAERVGEVRQWLAEPGARRPRLVTLYFEAADKAGHDHGQDSPQYADAVRSVDAALGLLFAGMRADGTHADTDIVIVSDHGMATVTPDHLIATEDMVPPAIARVVAYGQSIGIEPLPGKAAEAEKTLLGTHPQYDCWRKQDLPARWHYGSNPRIPAIVCQMREGWDAIPRQQLLKRDKTAERGSHGYDPALPSMRAVFVAGGPSFRHDVVLAPFDNVDVYPLLARLLAIPAEANDGDITPLLPALATAPAAVSAARP